MNDFLGNQFEKIKNYPAKIEASLGLLFTGIAIIYAPEDKQKTYLAISYVSGLTLIWMRNQLLEDRGGLSLQNVGGFSCGALTILAPWMLKNAVKQFFSVKTFDQLHDDNDIDTSFQL